MLVYFSKLSRLVWLIVWCESTWKISDSVALNMQVLNINCFLCLFFFQKSTEWVFSARKMNPFCVKSNIKSIIRLSTWYTVWIFWPISALCFIIEKILLMDWFLNSTVFEFKLILLSPGQPIRLFKWTSVACHFEDDKMLTYMSKVAFTFPPMVVRWLT